MSVFMRTFSDARMLRAGLLVRRSRRIVALTFAFKRVCLNAHPFFFCIRLFWLLRYSPVPLCTCL